MHRTPAASALALSLSVLAALGAGCAGEGDDSSVVGRGLDGPPPPADLAARATSEGEVVLTWRASTGAESYRVKVAVERGYETIAEVRATQYTHVPSDRTTYVVTAVGGGREGGPSNPVIAGIDPNRYGGDPTPEAREERGAVGTIDASFDVNSNGAATYTVPIKVPPGIRGIEPRLSVAYSSQTDRSGLLGVGFVLSGLSRIERCERTVAADGVAGTVTLGDTDRLCLDGMRLIKEGSGNYMADGSRYRTENETWTRVEAEGSCNETIVLPGVPLPITAAGPCTLSATLRNGTVVKYGEPDQTFCARLNTPTTSARMEWPITSVTDPSGNRMTIEYTAVGEHQCVPAVMKYTFNSYADRSAQREVRFVYENRALTVPEWMAGFRRVLDKRLARLETFVLGSQYSGGEIMAKQYRFEYQVSPTTSREVLSRMLECDGNTCLPPTNFTAAAEPGVFEPPFYVATTQPMPRVDVDRIFSGDFNGDGKLDYLTAWVWFDPELGDLDDVHYELSLSTPGTFPDVGFAKSEWQDPEQWNSDNGLELFTTDLNADGFTDLVQLLDPCKEDPALGGARVYMGSPAGLATTPNALSDEFSYGDEVHLGDFDGDGRGDVLTTARHSTIFSCWDNYEGWRLFKWNGTGFTQSASGTFGSEPDWNDFDDDPSSLHLHPAGSTSWSPSRSMTSATATPAGGCSSPTGTASRNTGRESGRTCATTSRSVTSTATATATSS